MNRHFFSVIVMITIIASALTSCKKDGKDEEKDEITVTGNIKDLTKWEDVCVSYDGGKTFAATAPITWTSVPIVTGGNFSITLKKPDKTYPIKELISNAISGNVLNPNGIDLSILTNKALSYISDPEVIGCMASFYVRKGEETDTLSAADFSKITESTLSLMQYIYVAKSVNINGKLEEDIKGTVDIPDVGTTDVNVPVKLEFATNLTKGWNPTLLSMSKIKVEERNGFAITHKNGVASNATWMVDIYNKIPK